MIPSALSTSSIQAGSPRQAQGRQGRRDLDGGGRLAGVAGNTLWIKTGRALSEQAPSGPDGFDPATLSPCEAWFGMYEAGGQESGGGIWGLDGAIYYRLSTTHSVAGGCSMSLRLWKMGAVFA